MRAGRRLIPQDLGGKKTFLGLFVTPETFLGAALALGGSSYHRDEAGVVFIAMALAAVKGRERDFPARRDKALGCEPRCHPRPQVFIASPGCPSQLLGAHPSFGGH